MNKEELEEKHEQANRKELIKQICISIFASILGTIVTIFAMTKWGAPTEYFVQRAIFVFVSFWFVVSHFTFPIKEYYGFIIKHRFIIAFVVLMFATLMQYTNSSNSLFSIITLEEDKNNSIIGSGIGYLYQDYGIEEPLAASQANNNYDRYTDIIGGSKTDLLPLVHSPVKDIFIIAKIYNVGYLIFGTHMGLAFETTFKVLFLLLASYEFIMMLTNDKKLYAVIGSFSLATAISVQADAMLIIACTETILVLLNKFMLEENYKKKVLYVCGMSWSLLTFLFTFYASYIITFGYFLIAGAVWIILKNRKEYKVKMADILLIVGGLLVVAIFVIGFFYTSQDVVNFLVNSVFPGEGDKERVNGIPLIFSYVFSYLIPFKSQIHGLYYGGIFSLIPITFALAFYYAFFKDEHQDFFMPILVYSTIMIIATISKFPDIINKIFLFDYVYQYKAAVAVDFVSFVIMFYYLANIQESIFKTKGRIRLLIVFMILIALVRYPVYIQEHRLHLSAIATIFCWCGYALLSSGKKEYRGALLFGLVVIGITGLFFKPVTIGMHDVTDLRISKEIQTLSSENKDAKWLTLSDVPVSMANFVIANGGTCMNATPFYQGEMFYKNILGEEKASEKKDIWNRYAQFEIVLDKENDVELKEGYDNRIILSLNKDAINKLGIKYFITYKEQNEIEKEGYKVTKIFETPNNYESTIEGFAPKGIYIYELSAN